MRRLFLFGILLTVGCAPGTEAPHSANTSPDYFERKLQCFQAAQQATKQRFGKDEFSGFTEVIYSPKRQSCVVKVRDHLKDVAIYSVEDLLTGETLWVRTCAIKEQSCSAEAGPMQDAVIKELR